MRKRQSGSRQFRLRYCRSLLPMQKGASRRLRCAAIKVARLAAAPARAVNLNIIRRGIKGSATSGILYVEKKRYEGDGNLALQEEVGIQGCL